MNVEIKVPARRKARGSKEGGTILKHFFQLSFIPLSADLALLVLRVWIGASLFLKHGMDKLFAYSAMVTHFPDPFHIGAHASLAIALVSDGICSVLVIFGLVTRWSALFISANIFVAWATVVHCQFFGKGVSPGETMVLYLGGFLAIFLAGPGSFSLDSLLRSDRK
jgi:putative oxidoreductase